MMRDLQAVEATREGWDAFLAAARLIASLPLEEWLAAFERAEALGPILDPTLYRDYLHDPQRRGETLQGLFTAALPLKAAVRSAQRRAVSFVGPARRAEGRAG